ncbi:MAG TPA: hypothetical protein VF040_22495 [Ktedonobacterales bacterium]
MQREAQANERVYESFSEGLNSRWTRVTPHGGTIETGPTGLRLVLPEGARAGIYSDAQIDDYGNLPLSHFPWRPPLHLQVKARASHPAHPTRSLPADTLENQQWLRGTAGFGFWNYPFSLSGAVLRLPEAIWFFAASPPSNMALVPGSPGWGWKAQVVHANRPGALLAALPTAAAVAWGRISHREQAAARWVQRLSGTAEAPLDADLREWHTYEIDWRFDRARFAVDGVEVLSVVNPPRGPLGFVAWVDNQYAIATPRGQFRFDTLATGPEWLEVESLQILPGKRIEQV